MQSRFWRLLSNCRLKLTEDYVPLTHQYDTWYIVRDRQQQQQQSALADVAMTHVPNLPALPVDSTPNTTSTSRGGHYRQTSLEMHFRTSLPSIALPQPDPPKCSYKILPPNMEEQSSPIHLYRTQWEILLCLFVCLASSVLRPTSTYPKRTRNSYCTRGYISSSLALLLILILPVKEAQCNSHPLSPP